MVYHSCSCLLGFLWERRRSILNFLVLSVSSVDVIPSPPFFLGIYIHFLDRLALLIGLSHAHSFHQKINPFVIFWSFFASVIDIGIALRIYRIVDGTIPCAMTTLPSSVRPACNHDEQHWRFFTIVLIFVFWRFSVLLGDPGLTCNDFDVIWRSHSAGFDQWVILLSQYTFLRKVQPLCLYRTMRVCFMIAFVNSRPCNESSIVGIERCWWCKISNG